MKKSRFTDSQIIAVLKQADVGMAVAELCRQHGFSPASFYQWRAKYPKKIKIYCVTSSQLLISPS